MKGVSGGDCLVVYGRGKTSVGAARHGWVAGDETMASIPVDERRTSIPVDKMVIPSPTRGVRGLGKPTTPQEPRDDNGQSER